ncbi:MAG: hypothetical protein ACK4N5_09945 [Myxococcales bacterium]
MSATCTEQGCDRDAVAQGLCSRHYQQQRRGRLGKTQAVSAPGEGEQLVLRMPRELREHAAAAAEREGVTEAEWWRRAGRERVLRQAHERPVAAKRNGREG